LRNTVAELRLTDTLGGGGNLVTDIYQAKSAVLKAWDGRHFFFETITLGAAQGQAVPGATVWQHADVGAVAAPGSASYGQTQDLDLQGSGSDSGTTATPSATCTRA